MLRLNGSNVLEQRAPTVWTCAWHLVKGAVVCLAVFVVVLTLLFVVAGCKVINGMPVIPGDKTPTHADRQPPVQFRGREFAHDPATFQQEDK